MRPFLFVLAALIPAAAEAQTCDDRGQDYAARIALCNQAFEAAETSEAAAQALSLKGEAQRMLGQFDEAAATLQQALGYTPENAWVWVELGNVRYDQGDNAGALAHYSAALAVDDYVDAWANRAESWWQFNAGQRCSDDADNALRIDPQYAYANEIKGRCLIDLGRAEEALSYFDTAISLIPGYQNAYRNKLAALAALGRYQDLVAVADEALKPGTIPDSNPAIEEDILARRLLALGEYAPPATVAAEAEALLKRYPQNLAAVNMQGAALLADGKPEEADRVTQILRQNPNGARMDATYHDTLARIDAALGRMEDAYTNFETALNLDPALSKTYARKLSELGFLPLSNAPSGVLTALRRCIDVKKAACVITK
ncbi:tetratricopeptide repeat protein [Tabrizicola sp.]|uniref:tetratricopeptide repeat protein n=1 Tax=Tabrizicola sp. TaxID=2005166 RepID=UPI002FDE8CA5